MGASPDELVIAALVLDVTDNSDRDIVARRITAASGSRSPLPAGIGEYLRACLEMAETFGERQSFVDILGHALRLFRADEQRCCEVIESEVFRSSFSRALGEMYRSGTMLHVLSTASGNDRIGVDALMNAVHAVVESATRHPIALLAMTLSGSGYRAVLGEGAAQGVRTIRQSPHSLLVADIDLELRNAVAHRAYVIRDDNGVDVLNDRGNVKKHVTFDQLIDTVLAGQVTAMALTVAVVLFGVGAGVDVMPLLETVETLPATQSIQLTALMSGWPCPDVVISDNQREVHISGVPRVEVTVDMDRAQSLLAAILVAARLPGGVERLVVHDTGPAAPLELAVDLARAVTTTDDPFELVLAYYRLFHSMYRDGQVELNVDMRLGLVLRGAQLATTEQGVAAIRRLIRFRAAARQCDDPDSADHLTELIGGLRAQVAGYQDVNPAELLVYSSSDRPPLERPTR